MKKFLVVGILTLVVIGCVLAAGCTTTTTNTQTTTTTTSDAVVGTWTLPNGTTVVFGNDFNGVMTQGDEKTKFTWKKTTDGKYQVDNEKGQQVIWTLDNVKGTLTNAAGMVLTKKSSDTSGTITYDNTGITHLNLISNGGDKDGEATIGSNSNTCILFTRAIKQSDSDERTYSCIGYYTEPSGGDMVLDANGKVVNGETRYSSNGLWTYYDKDNDTINLYAHWATKYEDGTTVVGGKF